MKKSRTNKLTKNMSLKNTTIKNTTIKNMLLKNMLLFIIGILLANFTTATIFSDTVAVRVDPLRYEPYPVQQGEYFDLWIKAENFGTKDASNFTLKFVEQYPFSLHNSQNAVRNIGVLKYGNEAIFQFRVYTERDVVPGNHEIKLTYSNNGKTWITKEETILIQSSSAILAIQKIQNPIIQAAGTENIIFTFKNLDNQFLKNIEVSFNADSYLVGTTMINFPFGILNSGKIKTIPEILPKQEKELEFKLRAEHDASSGIYKVPVSIKYLDELDNEYSISEMVSVIINNKPKLEAFVESTDILKTNLMGEVVIKVINKGLGDLKFLNIDIKETEDFSLITQHSQIYLGSLESDDFDIVDFDIKINNVVEEVKIPITLTYMTMNNEVEVLEEELLLRLFSAEELGLQSKNGGTTIILVLLIVTIGCIIWWRRRKKKKADQEN